MDLRLAKKRALVTGGSKGIGFACAEALAAEGCDIQIVARTRQDLTAAQELLSARYHVDVQTWRANLADHKAAEEIGDRCGPLDILVNNAGSTPRHSLLGSKEAQWLENWDIKVFGHIKLTRKICRGMYERGRGVIINVAGIAGESPNANSIISTTGNAALMAFSRALGAESVDHGVRVVAVNPGLVLTDRTKPLLTDPAQQSWRSVTERLPFKRMASPSEIGDVVAFLASERASYISGTVVTVDGGAVNRR
jgi:NAD(P)-dependent dehydrogenase (short-subunit alcohol dehydrogenase family)